MLNIERRTLKRRFKSEIREIDEEIDRSQRFDFNCSILAVEISDSIPRGLSRILPGRVVSFHIMKRYIRRYDTIVGPYWRRYFIVLPQTDKQGANAVKERILGLAEEHSWGNVSIATAVYPDDGRDSRTLLEQVIGEMP